MAAPDRPAGQPRVSSANVPITVVVADQAHAVGASPPAFGIADEDEYDLGTVPFDPDSDGDGVWDGVEVRDGVEAGDDVEAALDTDADGTIDALDRDDDGDGLLTEDEIGDTEPGSTWMHRRLERHRSGRPGRSRRPSAARPRLPPPRAGPLLRSGVRPRHAVVPSCARRARERADIGGLPDTLPVTWGGR